MHLYIDIVLSAYTCVCGTNYSNNTGFQDIAEWEQVSICRDSYLSQLTWLKYTSDELNCPFFASLCAAGDGRAACLAEEKA